MFNDDYNGHYNMQYTMSSLEKLNNVYYLIIHLLFPEEKMYYI